MRQFLSLSLVLLSVSITTQAQNQCQSLRDRLTMVEKRLKNKNQSQGAYQELKFQRNKLRSQIDKNCVNLDKKLENAFINSSVISD